MLPLPAAILLVIPIAVLVMAASLGMLKHLPCPAGKNCTAFQCLFKHDGDDADDARQGAAESGRPPLEHQESPRKRARLASDSPGPKDSRPKPGTAQPQALGHDSKRPKTDAAKATGASMSPVSPPITKRKSPLPSNQTDKNKGAPPSRMSAPVATPRGPAAVKASSSDAAAAAAAKKPESLNPRHLQKAPERHDIRWKLLRLLHEQYQRLNNELKKAVPDDSPMIMSDQEVIVKALDDEQEIGIKKNSIYRSVLQNRIMSYKRMKVDKWQEERAEAVKKLVGEAAPSSEAHKVIETGLTPAQEVEFLHNISSDLQGLEQFGYVASVPKDEDIEEVKKAVEAAGNNERCDRCNSRFTVFPGRREEDGALTSGGPCVHHPGKTYFLPRAAGDFSQSPKKWRCCDQTVGDTDGCVTGKDHVFKTTDPKRLAGVLNFAETPPNPDAPKDRAVCFDCEMAYTVYGMELIRLTAVSWPSGEELLDVLVWPVGEYIDLNTRYSGIRPEDMVRAERWKPGDDHRPTVIPSEDASQPPQRKLKIVPSPKDARDLFFDLISPETPLIGHGLENDLNTLRVIHPVVVDTIILYPHKRGLPARNSLKYLMESLLDRKIQVESSDPNAPKGHDSAEDARAAGELVRLKVRDEWKKMQMKGWTVAANGSLKAPGDEWTVVGGKRSGKA